MVRIAMTMAVAAAGAVALSACASHEMATGTPTAGGASAAATLAYANGAPAGHATMTEVAGGLRLTADITGATPGTHGIHVHTVGRCDAPDFQTAGGHWNPGMMKHGTMNPQGPHAGDLPNIVIGNDGRGTVGVTLPGATMAGLLDADGSAIVLHAGPDDLKTDPGGNSGSRVACGVFAAS